MRSISKFFILLISFFVLANCGSSNFFPIKKGKAGGLFELSEAGKQYTFYNSAQILNLNTETFISFDEFTELSKGKSENDHFTLNFSLNESGKTKFKEMTARNVQKQICFVIKDKIIMAPIVTAAIPDGKVMVTLNNETDMQEIVDYLKN